MYMQYNLNYMMSIHSITPNFTINFQKKLLRASCEYDNRRFDVILHFVELIHLDFDFDFDLDLDFFEVESLLLDNLNAKIFTYINTKNNNSNK